MSKAWQNEVPKYPTGGRTFPTDPNAPWREALAKHRIYHPAGPLCYCGWSPEVWPPTKRSEEDAHLAHVAAIARQAVEAAIDGTMYMVPLPPQNVIDKGLEIALRTLQGEK